MDRACKLCLKPHDGCLMTGHGLLDHLDPVAVFCSVLICFFVKEGQLFDSKEMCRGNVFKMLMKMVGQEF